MRYFLADEKYSFTDVVSTPDDIASGYYIQLVSPSIDYQTYLSDEYLDNNRTDRIIAGIESSLRKLSTYEDE